MTISHMAREAPLGQRVQNGRHGCRDQRVVPRS